MLWWLMRSKQGSEFLMGIKIDMSKAFDRIEWHFLLAVLEKLDFDKKWCMMISQCILTISTSVLINGVPGESFIPSRGVRKGDPFSPDLFIIYMEVLSRVLSNA